MGHIPYKPSTPAAAATLQPDDLSPVGLVAKILDEGVTDYTVVPFPRRRNDGSTIAHVHVRVLSDHEWAHAKANALQEMRGLLRSGERSDGELEQNLTIRWVLAEACRDADDPRRRFFEHGAFDVRRFQDRELAELWLAYLAVRKANLPTLGEMSPPELEAWAERVEEGAEAYPFYFSSQENVQAFWTSVARYVASASRREATPATPEVGSETGSSGPA